MADDAKRRRGGLIPRGRKSHIPGGRRETLIVLAMLSAAALAVWFVLAYSARRGTRGGGRSSARAHPASVIPSRVPYGDLVRGKVREVAPGRVEVLYDFEPAAVPAGEVFTSADLYPQLDDWNRQIAGSEHRGAVVRGEGRLFGEARTRLEFVGPVEVAADVEILEGAAAIRLAVDLTGAGYECRIDHGGEVKLSIRRRKSSEVGEYDDIEAEDLVPPAGVPGWRAGASPDGRAPDEDADAETARRRIVVLFAKSEDTLRVEVGGREVLRAPVPSPDPFPSGNVALRSPGGRVLWDDVRITGTLDRDWIESMMEIAVRLTMRDEYEPDDTWPAAHELMADGAEQARTLSPEGDVDWVSVATSAGAGRVLVETSDTSLGITTELAAFASDGKTALETSASEAKEPGASALVVPTGGAPLFYVRITEPEGRRGSYRLRAKVLGPEGSPSPPGR
ncbi:MAG: hypothetical protein ACYSU0_02560 [Planctomycetota bacterium]|jgi:hypothetical protein